MEMMSHHQNLMLALRQEMGWPPFKPANDCIGWTSGRTMDLEAGMELARVAQLVGKDLIYSGWTSTRATEPTGFSIAYRELSAIDIVDRVVPFAANDDAAIVLVSTRSHDVFAIDGRGTLVRLTGKPQAIGKGRKLAMKRLKAAAAAMSDDLLESNRWVQTGATSIEREQSRETIVRFG